MTKQTASIFMCGLSSLSSDDFYEVMELITEEQASVLVKLIYFYKD